jgi:hypothetical protein
MRLMGHNKINGMRSSFCKKEGGGSPTSLPLTAKRFKLNLKLGLIAWEKSEEINGKFILRLVARFL